MKAISPHLSESLNSDEPVSVAASERQVLTNPFILAVLLLGLTFMLCSVIWGMNKGFELTDESFYLLSYENPALYPTFSSFHTLLGKVVPFLSVNQIIFFRGLELLTRLSGSIILSFGFWKWIGMQFKETRSVFTLFMFATFASIGALLVYSSNFPQTISYNGLSSFFIVSAVGAIFFALSERGASRRKASAFFIALYFAGFLTGLDFFAKFSSMILLFILSLSWIGLFAQKLRPQALPAYVAGVLSAFVTYFSVFENPKIWFDNFREAIFVQSSSTGHGIASVLSMYAKPFLWYGKYVPLVIIAYWLSKRYFKLAAVQNGLLRTMLVFVAPITLLVLVTTYYLSSHLYLGRESFFFLGLIGLSFLILSSIPTEENSRAIFNSSASEICVGLGTLAVLPVIASIGTNSNILIHFASNQAPWFLLIAFLSMLISARLRSPYFTIAILAAALSVSIVQFVDGYIFHPYNLNSSLTSQTKSVDGLEKLKGIFVDPNLKEFLEQTNSILTAHGFRKGDPLLVLYEMPGVVYALSGLSPGQAWYINWTDSENINCHYLKKVSRRPTRLFLIVTETNPPGSLPETMLQSLKSVAMEFPQMFEKIGEVKHPQYNESKVFIYSLKAKTVAPGHPLKPTFRLPLDSQRGESSPNFLR